MNEFEKLLSDLKEHIEELEKTFIRGFILGRKKKPEQVADPDEYEHHVKAYCVLCHAVLEEYFEDVARAVMKRCIKEWMYLRKYTDTLVTLVSYYGQKLEIDHEGNTNETKVFNYLREIFDEVEDKFSKAIYRNNGISLENLRNLLIPVAIDITDDANLKNSLSQLVDERGTYAHKGSKGALAPEYAKDYVDDCLELCEDVKAKAESKFI